jgi:hypothetical protein
MAKIRTGSLAADIRGSIGGDTFSQNRFGTYVRKRAIPTLVRTQYTTQARDLLATFSRLYADLSDDEKQAWSNWSKVNLVRDVFGQQQTLTAHQCFIRLNWALVRSGDTAISLPPTAAAPSGFSSLSVTASAGTGTVSVTFAPSPLGADERAWVWVALVDSPGRTYVRNLERLTYISAKAATSPLAIGPAVISRFGSLSEGQVIHVRLVRYDATSGQLSIGLSKSATVQA